jgi:hypothetical protein
MLCGARSSIPDTEAFSRSPSETARRRPSTTPARARLTAQTLAISKVRDALAREPSGGTVGTLGEHQIAFEDDLLSFEVGPPLGMTLPATRTTTANSSMRPPPTLPAGTLLPLLPTDIDTFSIWNRSTPGDLYRARSGQIGRIDLHAGAGAAGFDALLQNLYSQRERADAAKQAEAIDGGGDALGHLLLATARSELVAQLSDKSRCCVSAS